MGSVFGALAGMSLLAIVLVVVVGIAIAALLLTVSFRLVVGSMPSYLRAMGAVVLTALASAVIAWKIGFGWELAAGLVLTWVLIAASGIDVRTQLLPDQLTLPLMWLGLLVSLLIALLVTRLIALLVARLLVSLLVSRLLVAAILLARGHATGEHDGGQGRADSRKCFDVHFGSSS